MPWSYDLGILKFSSNCGPLWGNGGDVVGYSNLFQNSEDGKRQSSVVIAANPMPKAVGG